MVTLYSTHCPKCVVLEKKISQKGIKCNIIEDIDLIAKKGFMTVPVLEVDGKFMQFKEANDWINEQE